MTTSRQSPTASRPTAPAPVPLRHRDSGRSLPVGDSSPLLPAASTRIGLPAVSLRRVRRLPRRAVRAARKTACSGRRFVTRHLPSTATIRMVRWDIVEIRSPAAPRARRYRLDDPIAVVEIRTRRTVVLAPDLASFVRLASSGLVSGSTNALHVRVAEVPPELLGGIRPPRTSRQATTLSWTRRGDGVDVELGWEKPRAMDRALSDALGALTRERRWGQAGGTIYRCGRAGWLAGTSTWPHGHLVGAAPTGVPERAGPFLALPEAAHAAPPLRRSARSWALVTTVANPHGRVLVGEPARYDLAVVSSSAGKALVLREQGRDVLILHPGRAPEAGGPWRKFATVRLPELSLTPFISLALQSLAAAGAILVSPHRDLTRALRAARLPVCELGDESAGQAPFSAYALSVASSRTAAIAGDPVLRNTALAGQGTLALPTVSVTVSSKRAEHVQTCLRYLGAQTYPAYEVVLGTHGYRPDPDTVRAWQDALPVRLRVVPVPVEHTLGESLGRLSRLADGDLLTKVDDDDHYGPDHLTDLVVAARTSGADLVAKSSRFTYFADRGFTIDRTWGAPEIFDVTPAGGTMLLPRAALYEMGGWSTSARHVDTDLVARARAIGATRYRTCSLGYVYVRRSAGHTWAADENALLEQGRARYDGLPAAILGGAGTSPVRRS